MKIAIGQIGTDADKTANFALVAQAVITAAMNHARLVLFPEATMRAFGTGRLDEIAEPLDGPFVSALAGLAKNYNIAIVVGMFRPADQHVVSGRTINRVYNTTVAICPDGTVVHYDKIHTYDAFGYRESDTIKPGETLVTFIYNAVTFGLATCYDLRFPQQFRQLARRGADIILVPTSWADGPGKLQQRQLLIRARALDATSWVIAADQTHHATSHPRGVGHSAFVQPDGMIALEAGPNAQMLLYDVDPHLVHRIREKLPVIYGD